MIETGKITEIKNDKAKVRIDKKAECSKCGMCLFPANANYTDFEVQNTLSAEVGDIVQIERKPAVLTGAVITFLIPLLLIAGGVCIGLFVIKNDFWTLGISLGIVVLWFLFLMLTEKYRKKMQKFIPVMTEIIHKNKEKENG